MNELEEQIIIEFNLDVEHLFLLKHPEYYNVDIEELEIDDEYIQLYYEFKDELIQPYLDEKLKDNYKTYCLYGVLFFII